MYNAASGAQHYESYTLLSVSKRKTSCYRLSKRWTSSSHLDEWQTERSPHQRIDDRVDTRVDVRQSFNGSTNQQPVLQIAVYQYQPVQLVRQPGDAERRGNRHAHPGNFASCGSLLLARWSRTSGRSSAALSANLTRNSTDLSNAIVDYCDYSKTALLQWAFTGKLVYFEIVTV